MSKTVNTSNWYKFAFLIDEAFLKRVVSIFKKEVGDVRYSIELSSGSTIDCDSLKEVLDLNNVGKSSICGIRLASYSSSANTVVSFSLNSLAPIYLSVSADEKKIVYLQPALEEAVRSSVAPYSPYVYWDWFHLVILLDGLYLALTLVQVLMFWAKGGHFTGSLKAIKASDFSLGVAVQVVVYALASVLTWLRKKLFPQGVFLIGNGIQRYEALQKKRTFIGGVLVAILAPAAFGYLVALFRR